jgi:hypothetical protein
MKRSTKEIYQQAADLIERQGKVPVGSFIEDGCLCTASALAYIASNGKYFTTFAEMNLAPVLMPLIKRVGSNRAYLDDDPEVVFKWNDHHADNVGLIIDTLRHVAQELPSEKETGK